MYFEATGNCSFISNFVQLLSSSPTHIPSADSEAYAGGVVFASNDLTARIFGDPVLQHNAAYYGGIFSALSTVTLEIDGGTLVGNRAYSQEGCIVQTSRVCSTTSLTPSAMNFTSDQPL